MPRANRYILPDRTYHITHRCHNRSSLFRYEKDRDDYRNRIWKTATNSDVRFLSYAITCNHVHLLAKAGAPDSLSTLMRKLQGEFAHHFNSRYARSGAFWSGRYHCTMIEDGKHLLNCLRYIDLNMVRAGVVTHPREWRWCGYHDIVGARRRYRIVDIDCLLDLAGGGGQEAFRESYDQAISEATEREGLTRDAKWTESIAVGSQAFIRSIEAETRGRLQLLSEESPSGGWVLREPGTSYNLSEAP